MGTVTEIISYWHALQVHLTQEIALIETFLKSTEKLWYQKALFVFVTARNILDNFPQREVLLFS